MRALPDPTLAFRPLRPSRPVEAASVAPRGLPLIRARLLGQLKGQKKCRRRNISKWTEEDCQTVSAAGEGACVAAWAQHRPSTRLLGSGVTLSLDRRPRLRLLRPTPARPGPVRRTGSGRGGRDRRSVTTGARGRRVGLGRVLAQVRGPLRREPRARGRWRRNVRPRTSL